MSVDIISYIKIKNNKVWVNDIEQKIDTTEYGFMKSLYKYSGIKHPKFYKMDELSKLGFIASVLLLKENNVENRINEIDSNKIGIVLQNSDSTIDVDSSFYDSIADKDKHHPSPALFVYTLPNISLGEISIYNKFRGENALFISEEYNVNLGVNYINSLFDKNKLDACIGGWFNANNGNYEAFLYLASKTINDNELYQHTKNNILKIYK